MDDFLFDVFVDDNFLAGCFLSVSVFCFLDLGDDDEDDLLDVDFLLPCCCFVGDALRVILGGSLISISSLLSPTAFSLSDEPSSFSSSVSDGCSLSSSLSF